MEECNPGDVIDVKFEGEVTIKNDAKVTDVRGGGQSGVFNVDGEVVGGFGEGFRTDDDEVCFVSVLSLSSSLYLSVFLSLL